MAVTGLAMVGFATVHMLGNLLIFGGRAVINGYAQALQDADIVVDGLLLTVLCQTESVDHPQSRTALKDQGFVDLVAVELRPDLVEHAALPEVERTRVGVRLIPVK